jgi:hypothetical protein
MGIERRKPVNAIGFVRLSDLRLADLDEDGRSRGNVDQERRVREHAALIGWRVGRVIVENDLVLKRDGTIKGVSAFKRRKVLLPNGSYEWRTFRPGLRLAIDLLARGEHDGLIALDLDRVLRDPRDLEDVIDLAEEHQLPVQSVTGSLRLSSDADITMARVMVAIANKSSRDTSRRVAAAKERQARDGLFGGGRRPFGFCMGAPPVADGVDPADVVCPWHGGRDCRTAVTPIEAEVEVIKQCSQRLVEGVSLRGLAAELREAGVATVTVAAWTALSLRNVLLRPRNAGLMVYQGQVLEGVAAPWEPIISRELFDEVVALLTDPARRSSVPGAPPRWWGSGIYRCGVCTPPGTTGGRVSTCNVSMARGEHRYKCRDGHLARNQVMVDDVVFAHIAYVLTHPRAFELLIADGPSIDAPALRAERAAITGRLEQMAVDEVLGLKTRAQVNAATGRGRARIAEIDAALHANVITDPLARVIADPDPVRVFHDMVLADRRVILARLVTVTLLPIGRTGRGVQLDSVRVEPKHHLGQPPAIQAAA